MDELEAATFRCAERCEDRFVQLCRQHESNNVKVCTSSTTYSTMHIMLILIVLLLYLSPTINLSYVPREAGVRYVSD